MAMGLNRSKLASSAFHWTVAAVISTVLLFIVGAIVARGHDEKAPCIERPCYVALDKRLAAIEAQMLARTQDRYTGTDAKRDLALVRQDIQAIRIEINKRIDTMHKHD